MSVWLMPEWSVNDGTLIGIGGLILAIAAFILSRQRGKLEDIPVMNGYGSDHERAMMEGALRYPTTPFVVETKRPFVIIPTCCYEELKNMPQTKLTFWEIQKKDMLAEFTGIFQHNVALNQALRFDLNRSLSKTLIQVEDKISWVLGRELGQFDGWKSFSAHELVIRIVARLVAGVFVGPRFTRDDEWTDLSLGLAIDLVLARDAIKKWPKSVQWIAGHFLRETRTVNRQISRMANMLRPVIDSSVLEASSLKQQIGDEGRIGSDTEEGEAEGSFMSWILKRLETADPEILARAQVSYLATRPEYTQPLREEIEQVVTEDNIEADENGVFRFRQSSLVKLWKLDSFMKESSRLSKNPITALRMVMSPITLSTGHTLPTGTRIAFASRAVHMSPQTETFSPAYNPVDNRPPHEFDGFRFYRLRKMTGRENRHQFVTVSADSLTWGYGNHACPGRFFADAELKVILIELLTKWDFRVADPAKTNSECLREMRELVVVPPKNAEVQLKRRNTGGPEASL